MVSPDRRAFTEAKALRFDLKLGAECLDPFEVASALGVHVVAIPLGDDSPVEGVYLRRSGRGFILVNSSKAYRRQRFTCAHEIGHHRLVGDADECDLVEGPEAINGQGSTDPDERDAQLFASEFLMPEVGVRPMIKQGMTLEDMVAAVVLAYDVSLQSAAIRLSELSIIGDAETKAFLSAMKEGWQSFYRSHGINSNDGGRRGQTRLPNAFRQLANALHEADVLSPERFTELVKRDLPSVK